MSGRRPRAAVPRLELPVERFQLACGALLVVSRRPGATICAAQVHLRGGHSLDPAGREGLAFLTGALAVEGTARHDEEELALLLEPAGGSLAGDATGVAGSIAGAEWELLLALLAEVVATPTYPAPRFERQRERLLERLKVEQHDPRAQAARLFRELVYGDHWLGRRERGSPESIGALAPRHLRAHHRAHWVGSRAVISVCGDVAPRAVLRLLDRELARWPAGRPLPPRQNAFPPLERRSAAFRADRQQVHLLLGHLGVQRSDPDWPALVVMDHVLGTGPGFNDRISRRLRDAEGLAYSVSANIHASAGTLPGMFVATIGTHPRKLAQAVRGLVEEIRRIRDEPVERHELELAQRYLTGSFVLGFERSARRAQYLVYAVRQGLPDGHLEALPRAFAAVTADDVQRVARAHLHPDALCLAGGGPTDGRELAAALARALGRRAAPRAAARARR